jgi:autotransporter-associated beta strand protein
MHLKRLFISSIVVLCLTVSNASQLAFPGAVGWGRYAFGGRNGTVYHVTNLNDNGTGSLRDAVSQSNRIVVFDVSGVIKITARIVFSSNLYVAGQTAPGEGIIVYGNGVSFSGSNNIIVRYMRFRMGSGGTSGKDCAGIASGTNMIFDHCSFSWGLDETFSINPSSGATLHSITISNSIIGQGLLLHSAGGLMQADSISLYRNFYCDNSTRNNKVKGINQYVNNIVYDWSSGCYLMGGDSEGTSYVNVTNNLFVNGPAGGDNAIAKGNSDFHIYADDNWQDKNENGIFDPYEIPRSEYSGGPTFNDTPFDYPILPAFKAITLIDSLIPYVGANLPYRDLADFYMTHEVKSFGTEGGLLTKESQLPFGIPTSWTMKSFSKPTDTDGDGMPDTWEDASGTDKTKNDAMTKAANGYANIENYINNISLDNRTKFLRTPILFSATASTDTTITLGWYDFTEGEKGFSIEQKIDGEYKEIAKVTAETESYVLHNLPASTTYNLRIRAFADDMFSDYSSEITAKTHSKQVEMVNCSSYIPDYTWKIADGIWDKETENWDGGTGIYADGSKVLISPATTSTIQKIGNVSPLSLVINGENDVVISGDGTISGDCSVNKDGEGTLTLSTDNAYKGATVLHNGFINLTTLKNGGVNSSIGASDEFAQNWIWDGGIWNYTGSSTSTNRSAMLYNNTEFRIDQPVTVTTTGTLQGAGNFSLNGKGTLSPSSAKFFQYEGNTILKGSTLYLSYLSGSSVYLGESSNVSSKLVLAGGALLTKDAGSYSTYYFPIEAATGTTSTVSLNKICYIKSPITGYGNLDWKVNYVREYLQNDWSGFYGTLIATGTNTSKDGSQLLFNNGGKGIPNGVIDLEGNTMAVGWESAATYHIGGFSGASTASIGATSKKTDKTTMLWMVGGANTDETFNGIINNNCSASGHYGVTSIVKEGSGYWRLNGKNIYSGTTTVSGGTLIVNGQHTGTGAYTVNGGATLSGKGTIAAKVTVNSEGVIAAGDTLIGESNILKLNGGCTINNGIIEFPLNNTTNNRIIVTGALVLNDATLRLNMDNVKGIANNTEFTLFSNISSSNISGTGFVSIEPAVPSATQKWDTTKLLSDGIITVRNNNWTDGIDDINKEDKLSNIYDLNGIRMNHIGHGFYIVNNKKIYRK